jgi:putative aldouronate transport system substrate-binding protein
MNKKLTSLLLAGAMTVSTLAGTTTTFADTGDDPTKIVMEILYFGSEPRDLAAVEDAVNEITIPEINVEVEFYPLLFSEASSQVSLMISSGSQLDLVCYAGLPDFNSLVNKNMVYDLDDLYEEYGASIKEHMEDAMGGGYVGGTLYGIPSIEKYGREFGILMEQEVAEAAGYDPDKVYTLDELDEFLEAASQVTDKTLISIAGSGTTLSYFDYFTLVDYLGADAACGGIIGGGYDGSTTITNVFASDEYMEFCKHMHKWYEAGYINQDAITNSDSSQSAITSGSAAGYLMNTEFDMVPSQSGANGVPMVAITTRGHYLTQNDVQGQGWAIPVTCENPEAAMQLLDLTYGNRDLINLLYYGIEGLDYEMLDDGTGRAGFIGDDTAQTVGFHQWFGLYGDPAFKYTWESEEAGRDEALQEYNDELNESNTSPFMGYAFNTDEQKTAYAAVTDVLNTYRTALESGAADPETTIPEFVQALEDNGIDILIQANQEALDAWLAEQ